MGNVKRECQMGMWNINVKLEKCQMGFSQKFGRICILIIMIFKKIFAINWELKLNHYIM